MQDRMWPAYAAKCSQIQWMRGERFESTNCNWVWGVLTYPPKEGKDRRPIRNLPKCWVCGNNVLHRRPT
eukprot:6946041-Pyramimonas_sp.AAC.1